MHLFYLFIIFNTLLRNIIKNCYLGFYLLEYLCLINVHRLIYIFQGRKRVIIWPQPHTKKDWGGVGCCQMLQIPKEITPEKIVVSQFLFNNVKLSCDKLEAFLKSLKVIRRTPSNHNIIFYIILGIFVMDIVLSLPPWFCLNIFSGH